MNRLLRREGTMTAEHNKVGRDSGLTSKGDGTWARWKEQVQGTVIKLSWKTRFLGQFIVTRQLWGQAGKSSLRVQSGFGWTGYMARHRHGCSTLPKLFKQRASKEIPKQTNKKTPNKTELKAGVNRDVHRDPALKLLFFFKVTVCTVSTLGLSFATKHS